MRCHSAAIRSYSLDVTAPGIALTPSLPDGTGGVAYNQTLSGSGGTAPYSFALVNGTLPAGLSLDTSGALTGTPTQTGTFNFTVRATDALSFTGDQAYSFDVAAPGIALTPSVPNGIGGVVYSQTLSASGGIAPYSFTLVNGALPAGLSLDASGALTGTPTQSGTFNFTVRATDALSFSGDQAYSFDVGAPAVTIVPGTLPAALFGAPYHQSLTASGGNGTYTYALTGGDLPAGLTVSDAGVVSGTPNAVGTFVFVARATDSHGFSGDATIALTVDVAVPTLAGFADIEKMLVEDGFDLSDPSSNSSGAFTFTSSNPAVATISGRTVTLTGAGVTTLTATQAAAAGFASASVTARLTVSARPDPTLDPHVRGLTQSQLDASIRFARSQQNNIHERLRQQRNRIENASDNNLKLRLESGTDRSVSIPLAASADSEPRPTFAGWGMWAGGELALSDRDRTPSDTGASSRVDGLSFGADRRLGSDWLVGFAAGTGESESDISADAAVDGRYRSLSVYGLWRGGEHLFADGVFGAGQVSFGVHRWNTLADAIAIGERDGRQQFGAVRFGYEHQGEQLSLSGYGRFDGSRTTLDPYRESGAGLYDLSHGRHSIDDSHLALGMEGGFSHRFAATVARPHVLFEYRQNMSGRSEVQINYAALPAANDYRLALDATAERSWFTGAGLELMFARGLSLSMLFRYEATDGMDGEQTFGLHVGYAFGGGSSFAARGAALHETTLAGTSDAGMDAGQ